MIPLKPSRAIRLLCGADLHLGKAFSYGAGPGKEHFLIQAWENFIDFALDPDSAVDAVLLAGDIFDSEKDLYEAVYHFEKGIAKLAEKGIVVLAVAGNHDARLFSLRSFFSHLPGFYILGKNGTWESYYLEREGRKIRIDGWSFPSEHFAANPLRLQPPVQPEEIAIGLLHCECPGPKESLYAPVSLQDLGSSGHKAWVLGHIHIPQNILNSSSRGAKAYPLAFYCGSLQGLDISEQGPRGAMVLDIQSTGEIHDHFIPLAPFLWRHHIIEMDNGEQDLGVRLENASKEIAHGERTRGLAIRFYLRGRVRNYQALAARACEWEGKQLTSFFNGFSPVPCWIEKIVVDCQPTFDLELLGKGENIIGQLAKRLLLLEKKEGVELLKKARTSIEEKLFTFPHLGSSYTDDQLRLEALRSGYALLDRLMQQKNPSSAHFEKGDFR